MSFEIVDIEIFRVSGLVTQLTTSQNQNFNIIRKHWQKLNNELKINKVNLGKNWVKYGITKKVGNEYFYIAAVPFSDKFGEFVKIKNGSYCRFSHTGSLSRIKSTIQKIYKELIPSLEIQIDGKRELIHYELYDYRFNWNNTNSVIDIYVPIESNT